MTSGPTVAAQPIAGQVVHLVGPVTDAVFSLLGPVTAVQAEQSVYQTVILVDEPAHRHLLPRFHPSIQLVLLPSNVSLARRWAQAVQALLSAVDAQPTSAIHLHGLIPSLMGAYAARFSGLHQKLYFSPHGSRLLGPLRHVGAVVLKLVRPLSGRTRQRVIVNSAAEASTLRRFTDEQVQLVESPVDMAFFSVPRNEARRPLLITGSRKRNPDAAALFAQLAVLLGEDELDVSCNWHGTADADSLARLAAAHVAVHDVTETAERARRLASGWIYVAMDGGHGFPVFLVEAMAAGLPCVVWDTPNHRELVEHGKTGLCCSSQQDMLARVAELIDSRSERQRLGAAARVDARHRFDGQKFRDAMRDVYTVSVPAD